MAEDDMQPSRSRNGILPFGRCAITNAFDSVARLTGTYLKNSCGTILGRFLHLAQVIAITRKIYRLKDASAVKSESYETRKNAYAKEYVFSKPVNA